MKRVAALALFCGLLLLHSGTAQDRSGAPADPVPPKVQRAEYVVRNGDAAALAETVGQHFRRDAVVIAANGTVLISATPTLVPDVVKVLELLDRKPRTIEVEVTLAELPAPKAGAEPSADAVLKDLAGKTAGQRIKLAAVEGQPVTSVTGGNKPYVSGTATGFGKGAAQKSIAYQPVGTTVKLTARVGPDDSVALDLDLRDSRIKAPETGDESGAPTFENATLTTRLSVPAGKAVVAQAVRAEGKAGVTLTAVIVTARVVVSNDPAPRDK
ncbi:hypothetical protein [Frigoriglobus tundricola]|uniref:Type II/III secretion system secretin-like domain-containing protein n=1 Tax=Frigoriglobus tundricola TaxID=2774151 RepID=A0A6M5Z3N3_9BACT|nr:hypothetical protein [Frigoriglobus tundricola]QJX00032.1 hypothetical protein FTUN_7654 [Frigoriglobus tundricola]